LGWSDTRADDAAKRILAGEIHESMPDERNPVLSPLLWKNYIKYMNCRHIKGVGIMAEPDSENAFS
jgi:hypothetical protein